MNPTLENIKNQALALNEQVNKKAIEQGKATQSFDVAGNAIKTPSTLAGGIPASQMDTNTPSLNIPQTPQLPDVANEAKSYGQSYLQNLQAEAQKRLDAEQSQITQGEQNVRSLMGLIGQESATRAQLEDKAGITDLQTKMREAEQSIANQIAAIDDFDDSTVYETEQMRQDASRRDMTKGTFGAQSAEFNLQRSIQRRGQAAQLRATLAANAALQGNFELATEQVNKALASIYDPIRLSLQMEQFFLERNDKRFEAAQKEVADLRLKEIDRTFAEIDNANVNVNAAISSGYASAEEIKKLVSLSDSPQEQSALALQITARAARAEVALQQATLAANQSAVSWTQRAQAYDLAMAGDPDAIAYLGFDPRASDMSMQELFDYQNKSSETQNIFDNITEILNNPRGIRASTGISQSVAVEALFGGKNLVTSYMTSPISYVEIGNQKMNVMGALSSLANTATFQEMRRLKESGVTFGALTEGERVAIGKAADDLFSAIEVSEDGTVTRINASESRFRTLLENYQEKAKIYQEQLDIMSGKVNEADAALIDNLNYIDFTGQSLRSFPLTQ